MMNRTLVLLPALLMACDSPYPAMMRGDRYSVQMEGHDFTVWRKGDAVEIIRHGFMGRRPQSHLRELMIQTAAETTGCAVRPSSVEGDTGVLRAKLNCD